MATTPPLFELRPFRPLTLDRVQQLLGPRYSVSRSLGAGGTSLVFLADDLERGEPVAVKVLRPELSAAVVSARFLREIEIGRRLVHPNVLPIYDYGSVEGELYCTMPFVDGETLRERLTRERHLSIAETIRIAGAVAEALDYAHGLEVIHRDIKPANILLASDRVVVADFGMARAMTSAASRDLTETGLAIGTAAYMSPEQGSADRALDGRTDVYALACVVYEMLAGEPPFTGPTPQAIIVRHCQEPPRSLRIVRPSVAAGVQRAVERALAKVPADRFTTAGAFTHALEAGAHDETIDAAAGPSEGDDMPEARRRPRREALSLGSRAVEGVRRRTTVTIAAAALGLVAVASSFGWWRAMKASPAAPNRFIVEPPPTLSIRNRGLRLPVALSRDGRWLAFTAGPQSRVFLRRLDQLEPIEFPNARFAADVHFSSDGKSLAYIDGDAVNGGLAVLPTEPSTVAAMPTKVARRWPWPGLTWTYSRDLVYIVDNALWRVSVTGGAIRKIAAMDSTVDALWSLPTVLPDGKTIALRVTPRGSVSGTSADRLALISIDGGARSLLDLESQSVIGYVDGTLIFGRVGGRIFGVKFDLARRRPLGNPVLLLDGVANTARAGIMATVSDNGTLAYLVGESLTALQILDERGTVVWELPERRQYGQTAWSPDGKRIAMYIDQAGRPDIWVYDIDQRSMTRLTTTGAFWPAWTPDGKRVAFTSSDVYPMGGAAPFWVTADGSSPPERIPGTAALGRSSREISFTPDGRFGVVRLNGQPGEPTETQRAFAVPLNGGPPQPIMVGTWSPNYLRVSPNGRWIAYHSSESGRPEVYVRPFPNGPGRLLVSTGGGDYARWSGDGSRLFYRWGKLFYRVTLDTTAALPRVVQRDSLLFGPTFEQHPIGSYDVHPNGKLFAIVRDAADGVRLVVVTNWMSEVRAALAKK